MTTQQLRAKIKEDFAFRPGGGAIDWDRRETSPQRAQSRQRQQAKRALAYDSVGVALVGDPNGSRSAVVVWNDEIARRARREELHTESNRSVFHQTEMPLPSELSTVFLGAYSCSRCSPRPMRRGRWSCRLSLRSSFICSWRRP